MKNKYTPHTNFKLISIPLLILIVLVTVYISQQKQEIRNRAQVPESYQKDIVEITKTQTQEKDLMQAFLDVIKSVFNFGSTPK